MIKLNITVGDDRKQETLTIELPRLAQGQPLPIRNEIEAALSFLHRGDIATAEGILQNVRVATPATPDRVRRAASDLIAATTTNAPYAQRLQLATLLEGLLDAELAA